MVADGSTPTWRRLLQLWRVHAYLDLMFMTRDLKSFVSYYISDLVLGLAAISITLLLAERFDGIGPWTRPQVVFMLGYAIVANGILDTFFGYNIKFISRRLGRGQVDHLLIQPQPLWLALLTEGFMPFSASASLLPGLGLLIWALAELRLPVSPLWLVLLIVNLLASGAVILAFSFLWGSLAFWAPRGAEEVSTPALRMLDRLKQFPLDGLAAAAIGGLLTAIPAGFVAWYPCRALLGLDPSPYGMIVTPLAALLMGAGAVWVFLQGLKHYGRTGSQRYLAYGHRR